MAHGRKLNIMTDHHSVTIYQISTGEEVGQKVFFTHEISKDLTDQIAEFLQGFSKNMNIPREDLRTEFLPNNINEVQ